MRSNLDHLNKKFEVYGSKIKDRFNDKVRVETIYWKFYESLRHFLFLAIILHKKLS